MGYGKQMPIHNALKNHGKDNFIFEVIHMCLSETDMNFAELYFIDKYNTLAPSGYNLDFNVKYIKDNPYLIEENNKSSAVQSIDSEPSKEEYNLSKRTRYPIELWITIKDLYDQGNAPKDICKLLDVKIPHRTMISKLQVLGCDTSNKARNAIRGNLKFFVTETEKLNIVQDYNSGLSTKQLKGKYNRGGRTIIKVLVENGLFVSQDKKICRTYERS